MEAVWCFRSTSRSRCPYRQDNRSSMTVVKMSSSRKKWRRVLNNSNSVVINNSFKKRPAQKEKKGTSALDILASALEHIAKDP